MTYLSKNTFCVRGHKIKGRITAPPSKSDTHRAIIAASLSGNPSTIDNIAFSEDIKATMYVMSAFGIHFKVFKQTLSVVPSKLASPIKDLNCSESGSTLRFIIPLALHVGSACTFVGTGRLVERTLDEYITLFDMQNVRYQYDGKLPLTVWGSPLCGNVNIRGDVSSQFISGLLFSMPLCKEDSRIKIINDFESKHYVDMTIKTLLDYGVIITKEKDNILKIKGNQSYMAKDYRVEGDYSNAAFWFVAGTLGGTLTLDGLDPNSLQGDKAIVNIINQMGGNITYGKDGYTVNKSKTHGIEIDASQIVDIIPIIAVLASVSKGQTTIYNGARLRIKESDRIHAIVEQLKKLGADIQARPDGMVINGVKQLKGNRVSSCNDHRIAMSMAIASLACKGDIHIEDAWAVRKSYPNFYKDFISLGGELDE